MCAYILNLFFKHTHSKEILFKVSVFSPSTLLLQIVFLFQSFNFFSNQTLSKRVWLAGHMSSIVISKYVALHIIQTEFHYFFNLCSRLKRPFTSSNSNQLCITTRCTYRPLFISISVKCFK